MKPRLLLFIFLCIHSLAYCQHNDTVLILPGSKFLQSDQLKDYTMKYDFVSYKAGVETVVGGLEDNFKIVTGNKEKQALRVCNISFGPNKILDSGLCFLQGLKPIYHRSAQTKKKMLLNFNNEIVNGVITALDSSNKMELVSYTAPVSLFDSYYEDIIAKTLPFKQGLVFKFPEYIYERGGTVWSWGEIAGNEKMPVSNASPGEVWKIIFYEKSKEGNTVRTTTYLVDVADRSIVSREYMTATGRIVMRGRK